MSSGQLGQLQQWLEQNKQPVVNSAPYYPAADTCSTSRLAVAQELLAGQARDLLSRRDAASCILAVCATTPPAANQELHTFGQSLRPWFTSSQFCRELLRQLDDNKSGYWWHLIDLFLSILSTVVSPSESTMDSTTILEVCRSAGVLHKLTALVVELVRHYLTPLKLEGLRLARELNGLVTRDCSELLLDVTVSCLSFNEQPLVPACFEALAVVYGSVEQCPGPATKRLLSALQQSLTRTQELSLRHAYLVGCSTLVDRCLRQHCLLALRPLLLATVAYLQWGDERLIAAALQLLLVLMQRCWPRMPAHSPGVFVALSALLCEPPDSPMHCSLGQPARALFARCFACLRAINGQRFDDFVLALPEQQRADFHSRLAALEQSLI